MAAVDRRTVLKGVAAAGSRRGRRVAELPAHGRVAKVAPPDAVGLLYDTTLCIGCKTCVVACREANDKKPDTARSAERHSARHAVGPERADEERHQALQGPRRARALVLQGQCMHCVDPACVRAPACSGALTKKREHGIVTYDAGLCVGLPLLPDRLPVQRPEVRVGRRSPRDRQVRALPPPRHRREGAGLLRGLPARRRHLREARRPPGRGEAADRREPEEVRVRPEGLRRDRRRRHAGPLPLARPVREAGPPRPRDGAASRRTRRRVQHGIYKGFAGPLVALVRSPSRTERRLEPRTARRTARGSGRSVGRPAGAARPAEEDAR